MPERTNILLPIAIIVAGAIIGIAIFVVRAGESMPSPKGDVSLLRPISPEDHSVGNPEAPVILVEYSDIDCQYCKQFQETMEQIMTDYGASGQVLWVYRHFPIIEAHADSALHAEAAECAGKLGGDAAFFRFIDAVQQAAPGSRQFDPAGYSGVATGLGLPLPAFEECIAGSEFEARVASDFDNGLAIGVNGTPYTLILIKGQEAVPVSGSLPYAAMKEVVEQAIQKSALAPAP